MVLLFRRTQGTPRSTITPILVVMLTSCVVIMLLRRSIRYGAKIHDFVHVSGNTYICGDVSLRDKVVVEHHR